MIDKIKDFCVKKPRLAIAIALAAMTLVIIIATVIFYHPRDNFALNADQKALQSNIQKTTKRSDVLLYEVLETDGDWTLAQINVNKDRTNYAMVIMNSDQLVMGPGSDFSLRDLINAKVPDKIINNLYPGTQWVGFDYDFNQRFQFTADQVKFVISALANQEGIDMKRITIDGDISYTIANERSLYRTETTSFKFHYNQDNTEYTFQSLYTGENSTTTYSIMNSEERTLYSTTVGL
ncbi:MAG: hypothetical protein Q4C83_00095 [Candidatus Saccharibacteria bacterium]|nr:hypothetical protein [Candidatus Saccharibacteria bacterium]